MAHNHELGQGFNIAHMERYVWCIHCNHKWNKDDVARALNAVGHLPEGHARTAASLIKGHSVKDNLKEYAKVLKGD